MNCKIFLFCTVVALCLESFAIADLSLKDEFADLRDDNSKSHRNNLRSRELTTDWWPRISKAYNGTDLKQCALKKNIPKTGDKCSEIKTCFFGTQECPSVGSHPTTKCTCNATKVRKAFQGQWVCTNESCPPSTEPAADEAVSGKAAFYISKPGRVFEVKMNLLTPSVLDGYDNITELKNDLTQAARFYVNSIIEEQSLYDFYSDNSGIVFDRPVPMADVGFAPELKSPSAAGATDFSTNNQEKGVDESDMVKSDGVYTYAAYGDILVVWEAATGKLVANYTLPPIYDDAPTTAPVAQPSASPIALSFDNSTGGDIFIKPMPIADFYRPFFFYRPKPIIQALSLAANRLVMYVQGYGDKIRSERDYASVFSNAFDTRVVILDTSTLPATLKFVSQEDIQGSFRDARSIGTDVHVVTTSYIDYSPLVGRLYRWNVEYQGLNAMEYKAKAASIAAPLIDSFVATLLSDVLRNGLAPSIPKISIWQSDLGDNTNIVDQLFSGGAIQAYVQLTSFSVQGLTGSASMSVAGAFTPSSWGYTYAVGGNLVFAAQGWNWSPWLRGSSQTTYLMGFKLDGASATPAYLGAVNGYILNQYSLSVFEGHLRVAATVNTFWPVWEPIVNETTLPQPISTTNNTVYVMKIPTGNETVLKTVTALPSLGKPDERFTAVRFFGRICYVGKFLFSESLIV